jgi:hypothetical protein
VTGTFSFMAAALAHKRTGGLSSTLPVYATPPSTGTVYYVNQATGSDSNNGTATGTPFLTLQKAANTAAAGSTINVFNGTYTASGTVLTISGKVGSATNWTVWKAAPGQSPVIQGSNGGNAINVSTSGFLCFSGFTITGMNASLTQAGAFANHTAQQYLNNGLTLGAGTSNASTGVDTHHVQILNCSISMFPGNGIGSSFCDYVTIQGCTVSNCAWYSYFQCCNISLWQLHNFDTVAGYHNIIAGNVLFGATNQVNNAGTGSTGTTDGEGLLIDDNHNDQSDNVPYTQKTLIANNICYSNGSNGIGAVASNNCDIIFNTLYHNAVNTANIAFPPTDEMSCFNNSGSNIFNNILSSTSGIPYINVGGTQTGSAQGTNLCFGGTGTPPGSGNITTDPLFVDTTSFVLQAGSPARNAGNATWNIVATDIYGNPRPSGGGYSLGAVQS